MPLLLERLRSRRPRLFVTLPFELPEVDEVEQSSEALVRAAPCQCFVPIFGEQPPSEITRILFVLTGGAHDRWALRLVDAMRNRLSAEVTIGYVEDETGATPGQFGTNAIDAILHDVGFDKANFTTKVVTDRLKHRGVIELYEDQDLVVTGLDSLSHVKPLQQSLGDATVAVVKRNPPLRFESIAEWIPRINPSDHADLILNLRLGSKWAPDFIGMLGLASAIASLGLLQNSPAVVIGSMLLAPLMTPMIGLGLALGQANLTLARTCGKTIVLGIVLTLFVSYLLGSVVPSGETLPDEVLSRGGPNVLDLLIAVFAAAAATFCMARPGISGAIAGVAIATALVPPLCSVGISFAYADFGNGIGAATLFTTNLFAIIVTSSFTFTFLGITSARALKRQQRASAGIRVGILVALVFLVGPLSATLLKQIREGKNVPLARPVTRAVYDALFERVARDDGVEIMFLARPRAEHRVIIHVASREELPRSYADELRKLVRVAMDEDDIGVTVVAVHGMWRSDADEQ
ncbi:MAG: DUF389 domain-containing protein [Gammaproteobacteria bacterium]